jgi:hypothetical protein
LLLLAFFVLLHRVKTKLRTRVNRAGHLNTEFTENTQRAQRRSWFSLCPLCVLCELCV